ncbi:hypothetical protein M3R28_09425 [Pseudomonas syringae]|uniref:hypothetical protein n=1 Tax=Pseudomonas syringae TaxID=317 RepID=UPI0020BFCC87|nr:hypothetical protein [Pseudomonas syringae]MCL6307123.1 hypothetical protein [Pseudomonas syringae]
MTYRKTSFEKHVDALHSKGRHSAIYSLTGRTDFKRLSRHFNMMTKRRHPDATYHFFWFRTGNSVTVCYTGNLFLLDAVDDFMAKAVDIGITGTANEVVSGRDKELFTGVLKQRLSKFTPQPLQRSFGGSHLGR